MTEKKLTEKEIAQRRDEALRKALNMPHVPHKPKGEVEQKEKGKSLK